LTATLQSLSLPQLQLFRRGKVRDTYVIDGALLMVATDRISAFDVVLPTAIPRKGIVLTQLSRYWFELTKTTAPNHLITAETNQFPDELAPFAKQLNGRSMLVKLAERIDIECVVRGFLAGSAWVEYRKGGTVAGERLPAGLAQAERLPEPIFTPAIKNDSGHDINISIAELRDRVGVEIADRLESASKAVYEHAADFAARRGILIADTKFEFGFVDGELTVIDEILTPDSSRFWDASLHQPGREQPSFDKQFVRNWLESTGWDKSPPGPELPEYVVAGTAARYHEAYKRITGAPLWIQTEQST
jgi:phosphoribosylaminoimidazole-succinocarboxamide synthase